ncbi:hypothetical protein D910_10625, partial [Dendroctonus ponderosae]
SHNGAPYARCRPFGRNRFIKRSFLIGILSNHLGTSAACLPWCLGKKSLCHPSALRYDVFEVSLLDDSFFQTALDDIKFEHDVFEDCESKAEVASQILENLENLVDLDELIKSEPSFMLPLLDEVAPQRGAVAVPVSLKSEYYKNVEDSNSYLFNEFEKVYYELNHGTLTPPQSPPSEQPIIATLEPILGGTSYQEPPRKEIGFSVPEKCALQPESVLAYSPIIVSTVPQTFENYAPVATPQADIAHELAVVDELVRTTVQDMQWSGPSSPSSSSCSNSNFGDCSSSDDPEWVPEPIENYNDSSSSPAQKLVAKKRSKPYSKSPDDKKNRKKEQNKNAATRYRMKKKAEVEEILNEEKILLDKHGELDGQITDLQREIKYLKGLMRDLFKAKGIIN